MKKTHLAFYFLLAVEVLVCIALYFVDRYWVRAQADTSAAHQQRVDCLIAANESIASCRTDAKIKPDDVDHCSEAVSFCKQRGLYASADAADAIENKWWERVRFLRISAVAVGLLLLGSLLFLVIPKRTKPAA
jgi:hypothetical protein